MAVAILCPSRLLSYFSRSKGGRGLAGINRTEVGVGWGGGGSATSEDGGGGREV